MVIMRPCTCYVETQQRLWTGTESGRLLRPTCRENTSEVHLIHKMLKDSSTIHIGNHHSILTSFSDISILTLLRVNNILSGDSGEAHCAA